MLYRIPHIGRADLQKRKPKRWRGTILEDQRAGTAMYFVHPFHACPTAESDALATVGRDDVPIVAAIGWGHLFGDQFQPEKSGRAGLAILWRFVTLEN